MGFFEWLFGWFFKKKNPTAGKNSLVLEKNNTLVYVESVCVSDLKLLEKKVFSKVSELKHLLAVFGLATKSLHAKNVEGIDFRLLRAVVSSKETLFVRFNALNEKLVPPKSFDLAQLCEFVFSSRPLIEKEVLSLRKSLAYTKHVLASEVKELGETLQEIDAVFSDMQNFFEQSSFLKLKDFKKQFSELEEIEASQQQCLLQSNAISQEISSLLLQQKRFLLDLQELKTSSFSKDFSLLEEKKRKLLEEKKELKQKFLVLLEKVDKPLNRFLQLASTDNSLLESQEKDLAFAYFQNIFVASKKDPKALTLKKILSKVLELVENDMISLKEKEKGKKISALRELIEFDFFSELFWKLNSLDSELVAVEKAISESAIALKIAGIEKELALISNQIFQSRQEQQKLEVKTEQKQKQLLEAKQFAEQTVSGILGKTVIIKF